MTAPPQPAEPQTATCAGCGSAAVAILTGRGNRWSPHRAVATCAECEPTHHKWVETAGPVQRQELAAAASRRPPPPPPNALF